MALVSIDPRDPTPLYAQLDRAIRGAIATGRLPPGDQLPTVRQMAVDLKINANTVARVYADLERSGVVATRRGIGTFITGRTASAGLRRDRERQLRTLVSRAVADAATLGFSAADLIQALTAYHQEGEG